MVKLSFDDGDGVWRTIGGKHIFIRTGESLSSAMKRSGKFKPSNKRKNEVKDESKSFSKDELKEKYGTDDADLINAGKEKEDRVTLKEDKKGEVDEVLYAKNLKEAKTGYDKLATEYKNTFDKMTEYNTERQHLSSKDSEEYKNLTNKYNTEREKLRKIDDRIETYKKENSKEYEEARDKYRADRTKEAKEETSGWDTLEKQQQLSKEKGKEVSMKEAKSAIESQKTTPKNNNGFTQKTDMYGGTREYSKEQLDKMEQHGTKPMEHSYTGGGWEGTKYDNKLSTKDIAKNINDYSKKEFPDVKLSRKTDYNGIDIHVMSSNKDLYASASDIDKMSDKQISDTIRDSVGGYTRMDDWLNETNRKSANGTFTIKDERDYLKEQLNVYKNRKGDTVSGNEWYLSDYGKKVISGLNKEMNSYNYDDSDGMVDYFNTNFYGYVKIGKWDKPYQANEKTTTSYMNNMLRQKAYQKYLREHPASKITFEDFKDMRNINK